MGNHRNENYIFDVYDEFTQDDFCRGHFLQVMEFEVPPTILKVTIILEENCTTSSKRSLFAQEN